MITRDAEVGGAPKALGDVERGPVGGGNGGELQSSMGPATAPPEKSEPAPMRNLYTAALSYNGFTITDGALRLIVLLHAADLGFNAIEIAFMFSMYEVSEVLRRGMIYMIYVTGWLLIEFSIQFDTKTVSSGYVARAQQQSGSGSRTYILDS